MPKFTHTVEIEYKPSFRSSAIEGMFDVPAQKILSKTWDVDMPIENEEWSVGMIVGPSGSGKTTIAKRAFPDSVFFDGISHENWNSPCLLDDFDPNLSLKDDIASALSQVGFSSPPAWLLPHRVLSNGQKFRAEMARFIAQMPRDKVLVIDEFTSVVDRKVAQVCSDAVQKMVRRNGCKLVAVSCHDDITNWLRPDWIYYVDTGEFKITRGMLRRPEIKLTIQRVHHSAWRLFKGHHYLSAEINKAAHCYVAFIEGKPVAFAAALPFPHHIVKNVWKGHRTVVLPDYQGIGLGNILSETIAQHYTDQGCVYRSVTSHPAMIKHRVNSPLWKKDRDPSLVSPQGKTGMMNKTSADRWTTSFEYIGTNVEQYLRNKEESDKFKRVMIETEIKRKLLELKEFESDLRQQGHIDIDDQMIIEDLRSDLTELIRKRKIQEIRKHAAEQSKANKKAIKHH